MRVVQPFNERNKSADYQALNHDRIYTDSSAASFTITLPTQHVVNDVISVYDATGSWSSNSVFIDGGEANINGGSTPIELDVEGDHVEFIFISQAYGWRLFV